MHDARTSASSATVTGRAVDGGEPTNGGDAYAVNGGPTNGDGATDANGGNGANGGAVPAVPTVAGGGAVSARDALLAKLLAQRGMALVAPAEVPRRGGDPAAPAPLAPEQDGLWFLDQLGRDESGDLGRGAYGVPVAWRLTGDLDADAMAVALDDVLARHEALRTAITLVDGTPAQVVRDAVPARFEVVDLSALTADEREARAREIVRQQADAPFALDEPPLLRAVLLRLARDEHVLALVAHHIVCDDRSMGVVAGDLAAAYAARRLGADPGLDPLPVQYADYAVWQRGRLTDGLRDSQLAFWAENLAGAPALLELPTDRPRPREQSFQGATVAFGVDAHVTAAVRRLAREHETTLFAVLLAVYGAVLGRWAGSDDVLVGSPASHRDRPELAQVVGMFANTVVLRADLAGDPTVRELLARAKATTAAALAHADVPFDQVAHAVRPERNLSHNPLFQSLLVLNAGGGALRFDGLSSTGFAFGRETSRFDLTWQVVDAGDELRAGIDFAADLFDRATVERLASHLGAVLAALATADPDSRVADLPMLPATERAALLPPVAQPATGDVLTAIAARAAARPDAPAVLADGVVLSYGDLEQRSRAVASRLVALGVEREDRVAIALPAGVDAIVAILGALRAGAAYLPLDPGHPPRRLAALLDDAAAPVLITARATRDLVPGWAGVVLATDDPAFAGVEPVGAGPLPAIGPGDAAYVIYTSGSTGTPKGVVVEHRTLRNFTAAFRELHGITADDRLLVIPPLSFDASVGDVFPALVAGASLVFHPAPAELTGHGLLDLCAELGVTAVDTACALWQRWTADLTAPGAAPVPGSPLRLVMVGGDRVPLSVVRAWAAATGGAVTLHNHYGPTEGTVCATTWPTVDASEVDGIDGHLPIGTAIPGVAVRVLDADLRLVPVGVVGEVCLGGASPARGYLGRGADTAARFVPDPFGDTPGARLYRTGDLGRLRADGLLEFVGRVDDQVKVRGHRIELAEVEAAIAGHPGVRELAVVAQRDAAGQQHLVAHTVGTADAAELRAHLRDQLPDYMIPGVVVAHDALPVTRHGKIDRAALAATVAAPPRRPHVEPRGDTQTRLAAIWADVLGVERVGATDNLFDLGGHSLLAAGLIGRIADAFGVTLPLRPLFDTADLAELAAVIDARRAGAAAPRRAVDLRSKVTLPDDVCADLVPREPGPAHEVLLTGATGFLGAHLLAELLGRGDAHVVCLVRAATPESGLDRLLANLVRYGLAGPGDAAQLAARVTALPGDLGSPRLGLAASTADRLAETCDLIVHNGGHVDFLRPYEHLAPANVEGTVEVLRLAGRVRATPVHLVSTLGVFLGDAHAGGVVRESDAPDDPAGIDMGYNQTKWVGDAITRLARTRGLPVAVHRPARVTGDSRSGIGNTDDYFSRLVATFAQLGAVPTPTAHRFDMTPVDHVAAAVAALALGGVHGEDLHYYNHRTMGIDDIGDVLRAHGHPVVAAPIDQWNAAVTSRDDHALAPFTSGGAQSSGPSRAHPWFDCARTESLLAERGLVCPPADATLLGRYLDHLTAAGLLPEPAPAPDLPTPRLPDQSHA